MEYLVWFIISFILIDAIYSFFFIRKARRNKKIPAEAQYLIYRYHLDIEKFSYRKFLKIVGWVTSFDIALVATCIGVVDHVIWQILFGFVIVIPVAMLSFLLLGKYYQQKQLKDNTKELEKEKKYLAKKETKEKRKDQRKGKKKNG